VRPPAEATISLCIKKSTYQCQIKKKKNLMRSCRLKGKKTHATIRLCSMAKNSIQPKPKQDADNSDRNNATATISDCSNSDRNNSNCNKKSDHDNKRPEQRPQQ